MKYSVSSSRNQRKTTGKARQLALALLLGLLAACAGNDEQVTEIGTVTEA